MDILIMGLIMMGVLLFAMIIFFLILFKKFDFYADMIDYMTGTPVCAPNLKIAEVKTKTGAKKWKILGTNIEAFEPFGKEKMIPTIINKKKKGKVYLLRDSEGVMHIMGMTYDENRGKVEFKPEYRENYDWLVNEFDERAKVRERKSALERYQVVIVAAILCITIFVSTFFYLQHEEKVTNKIAEVDKSLIDKIDKIQLIANTLTGTKSPTNTSMEVYKIT